MGKTQYSHEQTLKHLKKAVLNPSTIYTAKCINWSGLTKDKPKEMYSEIVTRELLKFHSKIQIPKVSREKGYYVKRHHNRIYRREEDLARSLLDYQLDQLGKVIDYQIPLKGKRADKKVGKIDLITYKEGSEPVCYLVELKNHGNKDTLLKCLLEIYTYYHQLDKNVFRQFLKKPGKSPDAIIKMAILTASGSLSYSEAQDLDNRPNLKKLIRQLNVSIFLLDFKIIKPSS